jgi:putative flippase GtrA
LAGAIFVATVSNFIWNRKWTWEDRKGKTSHGVVVQLGQYFLACGVAIAVQNLFTILLSQILHYVAANLLSIGIAALISYALNDIWTFALAKKGMLENQNRARKIRSAEPIGKQ